MYSDHDHKKETNFSFIKKLFADIREEELSRSGKMKKEVHDKILLQVAASKKKSYKRKIYLYTTSAAAILLLLLISTYSYRSSGQASFDEYVAETIDERPDEIMILSENGSKYKIGNNSRIICTPLGSITITGEKNDIEINDNSLFYKVIVPKGKRTSLNLMDGSQIMLNSESVFTFPKKFNNKSRTVSLAGEGFFCIKEQPSLEQFKVMTQQIGICVLGTEFNVRSSTEETEVVLVKGSVSIESQSGETLTRLTPGEMFTSGKQQAGNKQQTDTYTHTCWVDNIMLIDNLPLTEVVEKISAYYNTEISIVDDSGEIINGKLDLTNSVEEIVKTVSDISGAKLSIVDP